MAVVGDKRKIMRIYDFLSNFRSFIKNNAINITKNNLKNHITSTGSPEVTLDLDSETFLNSPVKIKATIRGNPKHDYVNWMKNNQDIDITDPKYEGSITDGGSAVLCISDAKKEDEGTYTIEVHNKMDKGQSSYQLNLIGGNTCILD